MGALADWQSGTGLCLSRTPPTRSRQRCRAAHGDGLSGCGVQPVCHQERDHRRGGVLVTSRPDLAEAAEVLRNHGMSRGAWKRYGARGSALGHPAPGYNYKLSDVLAAIGLAQLPKLEPFWVSDGARGPLRCQAEIWLRSSARWSARGSVLPITCTSVRLRLRRCAGRETRSWRAIQAEQIGLGIHFRALHLHPITGSASGSPRPLPGGRSGLGAAPLAAAVSRPHGG